MITFHELVAATQPPQRAAKNGLGQLPDRHHRCEAVRTASGLGWHVWLPEAFNIMFDGVEAFVNIGDNDDWYPLGTLAHRDFAARFDANVPANCRGLAHPYLAHTEIPGILQIWTGLVAKTDPDYSLLVRGPVNALASNGFQHYEGIVETDRWFGPLIANVHLLDTDNPIHFSDQKPFLQLIPIHRRGYADTQLNELDIRSDFEGFDFGAYREAIERERGAYAAATRRRAKGVG